MAASEAMISKEPKNPVGYRRKGSVLRAMKQFKEACKVFKKARYARLAVTIAPLVVVLAGLSIV